MGRSSRPGSAATGRGFTLIELLVAIAVLATIVSIALPNFTAFIKNTRIAMTVSDFTGDMAWTRSEAVRRGGVVSICGSTTGTACSASTDWSGGWIVFVDVNGNGSVDTADTIIRTRQSSSSGGVTVKAQPITATSVSFGSTGMAQTGGADITFDVCDDRTGQSVGTSLLLQSFGRLLVNSAQQACS